MSVDENLTQEFEGGSPGELDINEPNVATDDRVWTLADGTECSKSAFIREQFTAFNLSRAQISEQFDIPYRTVYGATVNMVNEAEPTSRGRGVINSKVALTADGKAVVVMDDGKVFINGEELPDGEEAPETTLVDRNTWIKEQVAAGVSRGDVAKALNLSYGVIYGMTKEAEGTRQKHEVEYMGEVISRNEYIRRRYAEGISKSDIAKELGVEYSVVWGATKQMKTEVEKYTEAVEKLEKFTELVVPEDLELFQNIISELKMIVLKPEQTPEPTEPVEPAAE